MIQTRESEVCVENYPKTKIQIDADNVSQTSKYFIILSHSLL